jgi:tetratricopeptide (TPR) repeat protein
MKLSTFLLGSLFGVFLLVGSSSRPDISLEVEYAGCQAVLLPGPVCQLQPNRELRLWIGAPPEARIEIRVDGRQIDGDIKPVQGGQRISLKMPPNAERMNVVIETGEGPASWSLSFAELGDGKTSRDVLGEVGRTTYQAFDDIEAGRLVAALKILDGIQLSPEAPADCQYLMAFHHGFLAERGGDYRSALAEMERAIAIAERVMPPLYLGMAEQRRAVLLRLVGRSHEAAEIFARLRQGPYAADSCTKGQLLTNQAWTALLAREAGESFGDPSPLLGEALETYETCEKVTPEKQANILTNLALAHLQEGRLAQAKSFLARAHEIEPEPPLQQMLWWLDLEARIALQEERPAEALRWFEDLQRLALTTGSADGRLRAVFGQARSRRALGDRTAALETLRQAEALLDEQSLQVPVHAGRETFVATRQATVSLHIEILLDEDRTAEAFDVARHARSRMLRQLERSDRLANLTPDQRARWMRLLSEYQEKRTALEKRAQDEWKLSEDQLRHEQAAIKDDAEALKGLLDQAFLVLNDSAEAPGETLAPPRPGELILTWCPLSHGWVGFAADRETIATHRFDLPSAPLLFPGELARLLLLPFREAIEKAERIRILPSGPLQRVDFHALPFTGDVLLAFRPVVYGLDLPVPSAPAQPPGRHALLVADPRDDLPGTLAEARTVRKVLEGGSLPWMTEELRSTGASAETVRDRLVAADLLHYAGHGTFSGRGGWESSLLLARETRLTLGDLLALERVPAWVVLSGCETGRSSAETPIESVGLAHAFLLAGSRAVVASTRAADDRAVSSFFPELYRQWDREPDLAAAFRQAQLSWRRRNPGADWAGFRLFER